MAKKYPTQQQKPSEPTKVEEPVVDQTEEKVSDIGETDELKDDQGNTPEDSPNEDGDVSKEDTSQDAPKDDDVTEDKTSDVTDTPPTPEEGEQNPNAGDEGSNQEEETTVVSPRIAVLKSMLNGYVEGMATNRPLESGEVRQRQMELRSILDTTLSIDGEDFSDAMALVIGVIRDNRKGVFNERYVFRGFPELQLPHEALRLFENKVTLFLAAADCQNPADVSKSIDLRVLCRDITNADHVSKIMTYFGG